MRILLTCALNPWESGHGGGQLSTQDLAVALSRRGHAVSVAYSARDASAVPTDLPYAAETVSHSERVYVVPLRFALRLARLGPRRWDVVHSQGYEGALFSVASRRTLPLVATTRHPDPPDVRDTPPWWRPLARRRWTWHRVSALLDRRALRHADGVVCVSRHSEAVLRERGYLDQRARVSVVHNGVSLLGIEPAPSRVPGLACFARLDSHKGIDVLLHALASLGPTAPLLEIYGEGPAEAALMALARDLRIEGGVRFHGRIERPAALARIARAEVLVLPSRAENFPRVILEAMALGTPIVATSVGGIPEAVESECEALLVPPGDAAALADAIVRISSSRELRDQLSTAAMERSRDFTWDRAASDLERLYETLAASHARSQAVSG